MLVGLNPDYEGSIRVEEMPVVKEMLPKVREKIGYVFQDSDSQLFMSTVFEDVAFAPRNYGLPETEVEQRVSHALEQIHIGHLRDKQIYKLSGGEKKMASIATILAMTPDIRITRLQVSRIISRSCDAMIFRCSKSFSIRGRGICTTQLRTAGNRSGTEIGRAHV